MIDLWRHAGDFLTGPGSMQRVIASDNVSGRLGGGLGLMPLRILAVSRTRLLREALTEILGQHPRFVVADACDVSEALGRMAAIGPDIVLIDFNSAGSLDLARLVAERDPAAKVVAFGIGERVDDVVGCAAAGIAAFIPLSASAEELVAGLERAMCGELACSPQLAALLYKQLGALAARYTDGDATSALTPRELEIADMIGLGLSNKEIANRLRIRAATVKNHVHNILGKLQVGRRGQVPQRLRAALGDRRHGAA